MKLHKILNMRSLKKNNFDSKIQKQNLFATEIKSSINQQLFFGGVAQLVRARDS